MRDEWGFDGLIASDWKSVLDAEASILAGLDMEMPKGDHFVEPYETLRNALRIKF